MWLLSRQPSPESERDWILARFRRLMGETTSMHIKKLSIDPRGVWSARKGAKVLEVINPEAVRYGIEFRAIDITTMNDPYPKVLLQAFCIKHNEAIAEDSVCRFCKRETS